MFFIPLAKGRGSRRAQRGASLLFALLTLAAMSLAAVALVRSVDTASLLAGNLGFKQASVAASGWAAEQAILRVDQLRSAGKLNGVEVGEGYYPTAYDKLDPTNKRTTDGTRTVVDWADDGCAYANGVFAACIDPNPVGSAVVAAGNTARFVITRLCANATAPTAPGNFCAKPINTTEVECVSKNAQTYGGGCPGNTVIDPGPFYRIVVRTVGARNTVTYTETIFHF